MVRLYAAWLSISVWDMRASLSDEYQVLMTVNLRVYFFIIMIDGS